MDAVVFLGGDACEFLAMVSQQWNLSTHTTQSACPGKYICVLDAVQLSRMLRKKFKVFS